MASPDQHSFQAREGNPVGPATGDSSKASGESSAKSVVPDSKTNGRAKGKTKEKKDAENKTSKEKRKKNTNVSGSSAGSVSDADDGESNSCSDYGDTSEASDDESKKKRPTRKRHEASRSRKKSRTKKSKKSRESEKSSSSESDSDTSRADSTDDSGVKISAKEMMRQLQHLVTQRQQQQSPQCPQRQPSPQYQRQASPGYRLTPNRQYTTDDYDVGANQNNPPPRSAARGAPFGIPLRVQRGNDMADLQVDPSFARMLVASCAQFGTPVEVRRGNDMADIDSNLTRMMPGPGSRIEEHLIREQGKEKGQASKLDFKRVDQVWDTSIHNYRLKDTAEGSVDSQYLDYLFHVRRTFDWEGKYKTTIVDIKSKLLRECLQSVMGNIKGISLVESTPKLDPNLLFLYLDDFREHLKELKKGKAKAKGSKRRHKGQKRLKDKREHLKVLIKYLDQDYAETKKSLYPMLQNGLITFDLLWALWKPNTLAFAHTYGSPDEPRVFKVEVADKHSTFMKGDFYLLEGKYFEFDGKHFGYGTIIEEVADFRGARKITSLNCYPLAYHKNESKVRKELVERGKKFVSLAGVHYKSHQGMAYYKKKKGVVKVNINGRIMVDPAIHRKVNPNYPISMVRPKDHDMYSDDEDSDELDSSGCGSDDEEAEASKHHAGLHRPNQTGNGTHTGEKLEEISARAEDSVEEEVKDGEEMEEKDESTSGATDTKKVPKFSDEDYLMASPVVLGFSFDEKNWLEFSVSGVKEIQWNEAAYDSLVLESKTKDIVRALVESHKYHATESIDDVIQGKGRGLVAVLHGPPGTGKTLTAEGISELLKCPLYMVSAGELGTDARCLEGELGKILDICHAWGAILLLDEADVFLEKRNMQDLHRNALVSIFLKQVEYVQNILILTTNRVETFDDAFQSRIHIALRYDTLDSKAKKAIFKIFIDRVRAHEGSKLGTFTDNDYNDLARSPLNGRQIKNTVRTAQALAVNKGEALCMRHIRQVLDVQAKFEQDLKGGPGYEDALRGYM